MYLSGACIIGEVRAAVVFLLVLCGSARAAPLRLESPSAIIIDASGRELYATHADEPRAIASMTKIFAALVVRARGLDLDGWTRITADDARAAEGGAGTYFRQGESYRNLDLLHAMLLVSDNRVPTALARSVGLTPRELLDEMNALAAALGLEHTELVDVTGILGNKSTAREMARALQRALEDPVLAKIMRTRYARIRSSDDRVIDLKSTVVPLWSKGHRIRGGKTGTTEAAGHCMMIGVEVGERSVTMVFLGGPTRNARFLDYAKAVRWLTRP